MTSRNPEEELVRRLDALRLSASAEQPSSVIEARLLEEFRRRHAAVGVRFQQRADGTRSWRPRLSAGAWLAVAASLVLMVSAAAAGWRAWIQQPAASGMRSGLHPGTEPTPLAAAALRPGVLAPAAVRTTRVAAAAKRAAGVRARVTAPVEGDRPVEFVAWPGARALPTLESGQLLRTQLPAAVIPLLGLADGVRPGRTMVPADVIVGQDGRPRAVRLVSDEK